MEIGRRTRVGNIEELWSHETGFSAWLAGPDGLELISQDLGIDVEDARTECHSEDFRCDIVGHLAGDENHRVVVEAQYGRTDHDHLGKLLTYASVHKATTGIWITERASGDHRQVIDWLNANTPDTVNLYLCELRAYRIGESAAAPQLDVICRPNESVKPQVVGETATDEARHQWRREFWTEISAHVRAADPPFNLQKPSKDHWSSISIDRGGFHVNMLLLPSRKRIGMDLYIDPRGWPQSAFEQLLQRRGEIEDRLGTTLQWMPLPEKRCTRILWDVEIDPSAPENREAVKNWFRDHVPHFHAVFKPEIARLVAPSGIGSDVLASEPLEDEEIA